MTKAEIRDWIERFPEFRVAVVGDVILDQYIWGHATRISPEAPVPIVRVARRNFALGGAANVMRNIASVGATALAFGVVGQDENAGEFRNLCEQWQISTEGLVTAPERKTTVKVRVISDNQQIVRIDEESDEPIGSDLVDEMVRRLRTAIDEGRVDAVILEDYHKGVLVPGLIDATLQLCRDKGIPVSLDPHPGNPFPINGLRVMTPNRAEAFAFKNGPVASLADGLGMGLGFTLSLSIIAAVREFFGNGSITLWGELALTNIHGNAMVLAILPAGGFITLGLILALMNHLQAVSARRAGAPAPLPLELDCRHCALCRMGE